VSVFICWSGARSHKLALAAEALLRTTLCLEKEDVFVSDRIDKGVAWFDAIVKHLETSKVGIVCLTAENVESPWLHFESGALALRLERDQDAGAPTKPLTPRNRLFTLLHGVTGAELKGPLGAYQATSTTELEMATMIQSIAQILGGPHLEAVTARETMNSAWEKFKKALDELAIPARDLIRELDSWFQRKTFNEPLHCCADQSWLRRYDGARQTRDRLTAHIDRVRAACSEHESGVFEMLVSELDGYAMALAALLLTPKIFPLGDRGELTMDPGIRTSCEDRRLAIRSLAGRLLHPVDSPLRRKEAVRFMGAETNEERKMIVHRMESAMRSKWEEVYQQTNKGPRGGPPLASCDRGAHRESKADQIPGKPLGPRSDFLLPSDRVLWRRQPTVDAAPRYLRFTTRHIGVTARRARFQHRRLRRWQPESDAARHYVRGP